MSGTHTANAWIDDRSERAMAPLCALAPAFGVSPVQVLEIQLIKGAPV